jgi:type II secretory pathway pseudopilin PulG
LNASTPGPKKTLELLIQFKTKHLFSRPQNTALPVSSAFQQSFQKIQFNSIDFIDYCYYIPSFVSPSKLMRYTNRPPNRKNRAFSLVEAIFTIAIIAVMSSIVVAAISNASRDANRIVARQQQATLNSALNAWVMGSMRIASGANEGQLRSLEDVRAEYNGQASSLARLQLVAPAAGSGYLDETTREHFIQYTNNSGRIESSALEAGNQHITLPTWASGEFPKALLQDN